ncbi:MAG: tetratricopeptide repeat protein [Alphaproteobacteria bacterium]|nr:tetratricopeptide repeat protein [Alphaproteobacteria bacterium]
MPLIAIATIALQILCGVHAVRSGNVWPWIYIIVFLPVIGCAIYFFAIVLPELAGTRTAHRARQGVVKLVDPDRDYRRKREAADLVGSADAKRALAEEYLARGQAGEARELFESAAEGIYADDGVILHGLARARFATGDFAGAQEVLERLETVDPGRFDPPAELLLARALEGQERNAEARKAYAALVPRFQGEEARVRFARFLMATGEDAVARRLLDDSLAFAERSSPRYRRDQKEWLGEARRLLGG